MRIIGGNLSGRNFDAPKKSRTHPMSEKMRGALFNALGDIVDLSVLDAFAGSGALSFEALSRGAANVTAVDIDTGAINSIVKSAHVLGLDNKITPIRANLNSWSDRNMPTVFDIVLLDPPYDNVKWPLLVKIAEHTKINGIVVLSLPPQDSVRLDSDKFKSLSSKSYGDSRLDFYRRTIVK